MFFATMKNACIFACCFFSVFLLFEGGLLKPVFLLFGSCFPRSDWSYVLEENGNTKLESQAQSLWSVPDENT